MTPVQKLMHLIIERAAQIDENICIPENINDENIEDIYFEMDDEYHDTFCDVKSDIRCGDVETGLPCDHSRHYEIESVAVKTPYGWVGFPYTYGGGKHAEPESVPWMEVSYDLNCHEEEKLVIVQTFSKT